MSRNFPDFIDAYLSYAKDDFCPDPFHFWTGVSILAGALERRCWVSFTNFSLYPNLYILMLSYPGMGKSTATNVGVELLRKLESDNGKINFIAAKNTEASLIKQTTHWKKFYVGAKEMIQSSSFFYASEGSNSLTEIVGGGDITAMLTELYDCPSIWEKKLAEKDFLITNGCCNILAGATFDFLEQLVPQKKAEGGFASRLIYVVHDEVTVRNPKWSGLGRNTDYADKLLQDLNSVYRMSGQFVPSDEFRRIFEDWFPRQDATTQGMRSERMQRFLGRKHTNILKLCMVCAASEGDSMTLEVRHWERALRLAEELEQKLPRVVGNSVDKKSPGGGNYTILKLIKDRGGSIMRTELSQSVMRQGLDVMRLDATLAQMNAAHLIKTEILGPGRLCYKLLADPNDYL